MTNTFDRDVTAGDLPPYVTVEQLAGILQIGRSKAYQLVRDYLEKGEGHGIPCMRIGHQIRVPLDRLLTMCEPAGARTAVG